MVTVGLFDKLDFQLNPGGTVTMNCDLPGLACDETNLVVRAARVMQSAVMNARGGDVSPFGAGLSHAEPSPPGVAVHLTKRIPTGGGLGGGSGDAAATLIALNHLWNVGLKPDDLSALGARLGSDVPFFFAAPSAWCTGRGDIVRGVPPPRAAWAVLVLPDLHVSTPAVYRRYDEHAGFGQWDDAVDVPGWTALPTLSLLQRMINDLEVPAFEIVPALGRLRAEIEQTIGRIVRMSGSGSTLFTLFDEQAEALAAAGRINGVHAVKTAAVLLAPSPESAGATIFGVRKS